MSFINKAIEKDIPLAAQLNLTNRCNLKCIHCYVSKPDSEDGNKGNCLNDETHMSLCLTKRDENQHGFCLENKTLFSSFVAPQSSMGFSNETLMPKFGTKEHENLQRFSSEKTGKKAKELDKKEIFHLLQDLAKEGCLFLTLSGGEIFLRDDLFEIIGYAKQLGFALKLFTNGTLITEKAAKELKRLNVYEVHTSLFSSKKQVHDKITQVPGSWEKTMESIRLLRGQKINTKIKCSIMKDNINGYKELYNLSQSLGADCVFDPVITLRDNGDKGPLSLRIADEDLQGFLYDPIFIKNRQTDQCLLDSRHNDIPCGAGHIICCISPYGDILPCIQIPLTCGNIREKNFGDIWRLSETMLTLRRIKTNNIKICRDCDLLDVCPRCPGLAYMEDGDILGPSSAACWMAKALTKGAVCLNAE